MSKDSIDLLQGTLKMLILKALTPGPMHGYAILERIEQMSGEVLKVEEGSLYPALHRMEQRGLLRSEWGVSENNRRAKYYRLTRAAQKELASDAADWKILAGAITRAMESL